MKVRVQRLDNLINKEIKLLKVEAEGAEPEVLVGCERILETVHFISADLGPERGIAQDGTLVPVINFLLQRGFELVEVSERRHIALFVNRDFKNRV